MQAKLKEQPSHKRDAFVLPRTLVEIQPDFVLGARLNARPAGVRRMALQAIDPGVLEPSPAQANIAKPELLSRALHGITAGIEGGGPLGVLLPDAAVRVSILGFETLPAKAGELEALIRWRLKESLGYAPEAAKLSWQANWMEPGLAELLVLAVKADVLNQYSAALGSGAVLILPATMALMALCPAEESGAQLLIHVCSGWVTHAVIQGNRLRLWRSRRLSPSAPESDVSSEAARASASARDRMGLEIKRAWYCARPSMGMLRDELSRALRMSVEALPLGTNLGALLRAEEKPLFEPFAAPVAGLLANAA